MSPSGHQGNTITHVTTKSKSTNRKRSAPDNNEQDSNDNSAGRKRITRACDQCNQLRSRCNGTKPCGHCLANDLICAYERVHKKRGRVPKKDLLQNINAKSVEHEGSVELYSDQNEQIYLSNTVISQNNAAKDKMYIDGVHDNGQFGDWNAEEVQSQSEQSQRDFTNVVTQDANHDDPFAQPDATSFNALNAATFSAGDIDISGFGFPLGDDFSVGFMGRAPLIESPDWLTFTSPDIFGEQWVSQPRVPNSLRFPVLMPILPYIEPIMSLNSACDLLEQYFTATSTAGYQPKNPYLLGFIFRKQSILHPTNPRPCTAALLASMLWISAQNSDSSFLMNQPDARARTCQKLLELIIDRLKPLVHNQGAAPGQLGQEGGVQTDAGIDRLLSSVNATVGQEVSRQYVDNIVTYIHLATVVSASERKAASLRWWNTAWSLARETKLGQEITDERLDVEGSQSHLSASNSAMERNHPKSSTNDSAEDDSRSLPHGSTKEGREERRRTWWMLYLMDRHLALCYNRPAFFLNKECEGLLLPMDEDRFQAGQFDSLVSGRRKGLAVECTSLSVYGFFLPLMVVLGEILDLNHTRNRPRLGPGPKRPRDFSDTVREIEEQLQAFEHSLHMLRVDQAEINSIARPVADALDQQKSILQAKMVVAYATHIMHVLHILLTGKWDPIAMLDDNDLWISSQSFVNATSHAVQAADALADIIDCDPDLALMPYFFGIYLLQGSFLLLLFADKLQNNITPDVVHACETIVRAHEACISTLDTQYQRNFRRVMRSALQQLRGRTHEDATEQQHWRREILKLYRWTGDGTGLAL